MNREREVRQGERHATKRETQCSGTIAARSHHRRRSSSPEVLQFPTIGNTPYHSSRRSGFMMPEKKSELRPPPLQPLLSPEKELQPWRSPVFMETEGKGTTSGSS